MHISENMHIETDKRNQDNISKYPIISILIRFLSFRFPTLVIDIVLNK